MIARGVRYGDRNALRRNHVHDRPDDAARTISPARSRPAGCIRSTSPSTRTSRCRGVLPRRRATPSSPRSTSARSTRSWRSPAAATVTERVLLGTGICLGRATRADRHRQGGRDAGSALGRSLRLRHRLRVERRRARAPRRRRCRSGATSSASTCSRCAQLWREDEAEYHGKYVELAPSWSWPKPARTPASPARPCSSAARPGRRCSPTSPSTRTAGSRSAAAGSAPRSPSCTRRARRSGATRRVAAHRAVRDDPRRGQARVLRVARHRGDRAAGPVRRRRRGPPPARPVRRTGG